jgi:hypothetical protein
VYKHAYVFIVCNVNFNAAHEHTHAYDQHSLLYISTILPNTQSHTHTHNHNHNNTHTSQSHTRTITITHTHTLTHNRNHTHTHNHNHTHTHTQIHLVDASGLTLPGKGPTFVRLILPFPRDAHQEQRTPLSNEYKPKPLDEAEPQFDAKFTFDTPRSQTLLRSAEKNLRVSLEVYLVTKVMFISKNVFIGKVELRWCLPVSTR